MINNKALFGGGFFVALGLYLLKHSLDSLKLFKESQSWPKVSGRVLKSELVKFKNSHSLFVSYQYQAGGKKYESNRIALWTLGGEFSVKFASEFKLGEACEVHYNPRKPKQAVLIPGPPAHGKRYSDLILSIVATTVGSAIICYALLMS